MELSLCFQSNRHTGNRIKRFFWAVIFLATFSPLVVADSITKPHTFSNDSTADASQVNADFDTLYNQVNKIGSVINIDDTNHRVGIMNSSPSYPLDVYGTIRGRGTSSGSYGLYGFNQYSTGQAINAYAYSTTGSNYAVYARTNSSAGKGVFAFAYSSTGTNYGIYARTRSATGYAGYFLGGKNYFQGRVGIGNSSPSYKLDVNGQINAISGLCINGDCKSSWAHTSPVSAGSGFAYYDDGDFGIGTDSPDTLLHLKTSTSEESILTIENTDADSDGSSLRFKKTSSSPADNDILGEIEFYGKDSSGAMTRYAHISSSADDVTNTTEDGNISLHVYDGVYDREKIMLSVTSQGVGVGVTNPEGKLHVNSGNYTGTGTISCSAGTTSVTGSGTSFSTQLKRGGEIYVDGIARRVVNIGNNTTLTVNKPWPSAFSDENFKYTKPYLFVKSDGKVGIGTTTPSSKLEVVGPIKATGSSSDTYAMRATSEKSTGYAIYALANSTSGANYGLYSKTTSMSGRAVYAYASASSGTPYALFGSVSSSTGYAGYFTGGKNYFQGRVGIGDSTPAYKLDVNGTIRHFGIVDSSDIRWKKNIQPLKNSLNRVIALRGVSFEWRQDEFPDKHFQKGRKLGVIAQEVEKVVPEVVLTDQTGFKSVGYTTLVPLLIEAVKELKKENDALRKDLVSLKERLGL